MMAHRSVDDISLTVLLMLQLYFLFFLQPAASIGIDFGLPVTKIVSVVVVGVIMAVSPGRGAATVMRRRLQSMAADLTRSAIRCPYAVATTPSAISSPASRKP